MFFRIMSQEFVISPKIILLSILSITVQFTKLLDEQNFAIVKGYIVRIFLKFHGFFIFERIEL